MDKNQNRPNDTRFKKGVSGNPNGRPKGSTNKVPSTNEVLDGIKRLNKQALKTLADLLYSDKEETKLKAAVKIVDINYSIVAEEVKHKRTKQNKVVKQPKKPEEKEPEIKAQVEEISDNCKVLRISRDRE